MFSQFFHLPFQQYSLQEISTVYPEYSKSMQAYLWVYQRGLSPHFRSHGTVPRIDSHSPWSLRACIATHRIRLLKKICLTIWARRCLALVLSSNAFPPFYSACNASAFFPCLWSIYEASTANCASLPLINSCACSKFLVLMRAMRRACFAQGCPSGSTFNTTRKWVIRISY